MEIPIHIIKRRASVKVTKYVTYCSPVRFKAAKVVLLSSDRFVAYKLEFTDLFRN